MNHTGSCRSRKPRYRRLVLLLLSIAACPVHALYTLEQMLNEPWFDAADIEAVRQGGFGVARIHEVSEREIAVVIACLVKGTREAALAPFPGDALPIDEKLLHDQQLINAEHPEASFAAITLESDERDEVRHYLDAKPGVGLNLSREETIYADSPRTASRP